MTQTAAPHVDEREDRQRITKDEATDEARQLLLAADHGVLCTLSAKVGGWPFGSVVPYAIDAFGRPVFMVATIAEHYRNIQADERVSLFVQAPEATSQDGVDVQTFGRLTVMGRASIATSEEREDMAPRYYFRLPSSRGYNRTHDFVFVKIDIERVRYIGGFGKIFWLDAAGFAVDPANDELRSAAQGSIDHMNEDHRDALVDMVRGYYALDVTEEHVRLTGIDQRGLWIDVEGHGPHRVDFPRPTDQDGLRPSVIEAVKVARARLAG